MSHDLFALIALTVAAITTPGCSETSSPASIRLHAVAPSGGHYLSDTPMSARAGKIDFSAKDIERAWAGNSRSPLFVLTSARPRQDAEHAAVGVSMQRDESLRTSSARGLLAALRRGRRQPAPGVDAVVETQTGGHRAARVLLDENSKLELIVAVILVGDTAFTVAGSMPMTDAAATARSAIETFIATLNIDVQE